MLPSLLGLVQDPARKEIESRVFDSGSASVKPRLYSDGWNGFTFVKTARSPWATYISERRAMHGRLVTGPDWMGLGIGIGWFGAWVVGLVLTTYILN